MYSEANYYRKRKRLSKHYPKPPHPTTSLKYLYGFRNIDPDKNRANIPCTAEQIIEANDNEKTRKETKK